MSKDRVKFSQTEPSSVEMLVGFWGKASVWGLNRGPRYFCFGPQSELIRPYVIRTKSHAVLVSGALLLHRLTSFEVQY